MCALRPSRSGVGSSFWLRDRAPELHERADGDIERASLNLEASAALREDPPEVVADGSRTSHRAILSLLREAAEFAVWASSR